MGAVEIAAALAASRKAVRLYPPQHPAHREALTGLVDAVTEAVDVRPLVLNLREGRLYEGSDVLSEASPATHALAEAMEVRRVESLTFHMGFGETDGTGLSEVLSLRPSPDLSVLEELEGRDVRAVTVSELEDNTAREAEERDRRREADRALYRHALTALKDIAAALGDDEPVESVGAARTIALIIDRIAEEPEAMIALAMMTGHGEHWRFHAVGVMLFSLVLGRGIGLSDQELLSLGLAALLHDTGSFPRAAEDDAAGPAPAPDPSDHSIVGAHSLGSLLDEDCFTMIVAYEHHMGVDGSGFPGRGAGYVTHPYSRITAVADRYYALVRPDEGQPARPDQAAAQLLRDAAGGPLDPGYARLFVEAVGAIPVGCVVRLSDHSVGIVRAPGEDPLQPQVRLVLASDGAELRPTADVDLVQDERALVEVLAAELLDLQPSDYL